jgi:hypothetical protein
MLIQMSAPAANFRLKLGAFQIMMTLTITGKILLTIRF